MNNFKRENEMLFGLVEGFTKRDYGQQREFKAQIDEFNCKTLGIKQLQDSSIGVTGGFAVPVTVSDHIFTQALSDSVFDRAIMQITNERRKDLVTVQELNVRAYSDKSTTHAEDNFIYREQEVPLNDLFVNTFVSNVLLEQRGQGFLEGFYRWIALGFRQYIATFFFSGLNSIGSLTRPSNVLYSSTVTKESITLNDLQSMVDLLNVRREKRDLAWIGNSVVEHALQRTNSRVLEGASAVGGTLAFVNSMEGDTFPLGYRYVQNNYIPSTFTASGSTLGFGANGVPTSTGVLDFLGIVDKTKIVLSMSPVLEIGMSSQSRQGYDKFQTVLRAFRRVGWTMLSFTDGGTDYCTIRGI